MSDDPTPEDLQRIQKYIKEHWSSGGSACGQCDELREQRDSLQHRLSQAERERDRMRDQRDRFRRALKDIADRYNAGPWWAMHFALSEKDDHAIDSATKEPTDG